MLAACTNSLRPVAITANLLAAVVNVGCQDPVTPRALTITAVSPASGPLAGGSSVTITGTNFSNVISVTIGASEVSNRTVVSPTQITGSTPPATTSGAQDVVVTSNSHGSGTCSGCFTYNPRVTVGDVSPASGPLVGGTSVTISGTSFIDVTSVTIGGAELGSRAVVSATEIAGTTPASTSAGARDVVVTSSSQGSGTCAGCFSYVPDIGLQVQPLAAGANYACALDDAGAAYCWGSGDQLGNGSRASVPAPVPVSGVLRFSALAAGAGHACGLTLDGRAFCWGGNSEGQIGNGRSGGVVVVPDYVLGGRTFSGIAAGSYHSCALASDGAAYCWGAWIHTSSSTPVAVPGELRFNSMVAGGAQSCALTSSGAAYCWGGATPTPTAVPGGLTFTSLVAGLTHVCGLSSGAAYCWGANLRGQLGDGSNMSSSTPVAVAGGHTFTTLGSGPAAMHTCGLTASGAAYCWGGNGYGELGDGTYGNRSTPVGVVGGLSFATLAAGERHTCARSSAGAAYYCWGDDSYGQLGDGDNQALDPLPVSGMPPAVAVEVGGHSCALTSGGSTYCWGGGSATPVAVSGGLTFSAVTAGGWHTCGITTAGPTYCWGSNWGGQLGDGSNTTSSTPVAVTGGLTFSAVTAGSLAHTCGLTSAGAAYCWGENAYGQLGTGSADGGAYSPVAVSGGLTFRAVAAGTYHTCGITSANAAYCWGWNWGGQLGNGLSGYYEQSPSPGPVLGGLESAPSQPASITLAGLRRTGRRTAGATTPTASSATGHPINV